MKNECTSIINETMMNNDNDNNTLCFYRIIFDNFYHLFFACLLILSDLRLRNYSKINILIINYKINIESLQMKNKYYYDCDDIIIYDFDFDIGLVKIFKRE